MLQQMDLLSAHSQPCIFQLDTAANGLAGVAGQLYCSVDAVGDGLATCMWTLYFNVSVMPEE